MTAKSVFLASGALVALASPRALAATDYNGDGRSDIAFHRPDGSWNEVSVLLSSGDGWAGVSKPVPSWGNETGAIALPGDFNGDGRTDVAFHRPGGGWTTVPVLLADGSGGWTAVASAAPKWANEPDAVALVGDHDGDGKADLAFHRPGSAWTTVPVLLATGEGRWTATAGAAPSWANQSGVVGMVGDYDGDGRTDLAFHRPGSTWTTVPTLLSEGNGTWTATNVGAPKWANEPGTVAIGGDYDGDGRSDLAFHRPSSGWTTVPVLRSSGDGTWTASAATAPAWANQPGAVALAGDYDGDARTDLAFYRPDGVWDTVPLLMRSGEGTWAAHDTAAPAWANQSGVVAMVGDYDGDGRSDLAFHRADGEWTSVPVLASKGNGAWAATARAASSWANQLRAVAVAQGPRVSLAHLATLSDGGDPAYDTTEEEEDAWRDALEGWLDFLRVFVRLVLGYQAYVEQSGLRGTYDGLVWNGHSSASASMVLEHADGQVHGKLYILSASLRLPGGACSDVVFPVSVIPVHATASDLYHAFGTTTRDVHALGVLSGSVDIAFSFSLETAQYRQLDGTIYMDVPWPCANQSLTFRFQRRPLL